MDSLLVSAGTAEIGDRIVPIETGNETIDLLIKILVPIFTGIIFPTLKDYFKKRREDRDKVKHFQS